MKKFVVIIFLLLLMLSLSSCKKFDPNNKDNLYAQIVIKGGKKINLELNYSEAPTTVDNFIKLASDGFYDNTIFHRVISGFMIQGGGYIKENGQIKEKTADSIVGEFKANGYTNNIKHVLGTISMARAKNPNSASSQFFLCCDTCDWLDGDYAAFGKTTDKESNDVIISLSNVETYYFSSSFADMPVDTIIIKNIKLKNKAF